MIEDLPRANERADGSHAGHASAECQWCPLCQFVAVLRGERPEFTERVAEAGTALLAALRGFVEAAAATATATSPTPGAPHRPPGSSAPRVQHIDLAEPG